MKRFLLAVTAIALSSTALAADLAPQAAEPIAPIEPYSWTGFYAGVNAGGVFGTNKTKTIVPADNDINDEARAMAIALGRQDIHTNGFIGGAQIGYNYQFGAFVVGAEADIDGIANKKHHNTGVVDFNGDTGQNIDHASNNYLSTIRARFGYALDRLLIYGTGGIAIADQHFKRSQLWSFEDGCPAAANGLQACHAGSQSSTSVGYALGAGAEYAFADHWTVKAEYIFAGFDSSKKITTQNAAFPGQPIVFKSKLSNMNVVRLGVNYKF